ncbi:hypothetical protein LOY34_13810 [Pseudomonas sp. B21-009]|uniref:hypothetical protein n=1 Tax=Pseudomonas sp. B21-009 TaxID=2895470 RepID=UPI0021606F11|nr:hypothetical protein [Pseudomonas sp. B21-009]UVM64428.1 hypothetical protein LOY34_13810 [Pseudomonas sp. B21-009]
MTIYITVEQVDALLGPAWAPDGQEARAVLMANTWLTNLGLPAFDPVPDDVVQAGAEIAREAAAGNIFGAKETGGAEQVGGCRRSVQQQNLFGVRPKDQRWRVIRLGAAEPIPGHRPGQDSEGLIWAFEASCRPTWPKPSTLTWLML